MNLFKVKPKVIPSFAYKYRYKGYFEQKHEYYKRISLLCGTSINEDNQIFLSLKKNLANDTNIEVIDKIDYFPHLSPEIPITKAEQLLTKFLFDIYNLALLTSFDATYLYFFRIQEKKQLSTRLPVDNFL